jgi:hypothetical protein
LRWIVRKKRVRGNNSEKGELREEVGKEALEA